MPVRTRWEAIAPVYRSRNGNGPGLPGPLSWRVDDASGVEGALEVADLVLGAVTVPAVLLLELAGEDLAAALGDVEDVTREVAPLLLGLALQLGPLAGDDVLVHALHLWLRGNGQCRNPAVTVRSTASAQGQLPSWPSWQSWAVSLMESPADSMSLPTPSTVWQADSRPIDSIEIRIADAKCLRLICICLSLVPWERTAAAVVRHMEARSA